MNSLTNVSYTLEQEDYDEYMKSGIPITAFLIVLCVVGTIGNLHVFLVYLLRYKPSIYKKFVLCLTAVDFVGCSFCVPATLYIIRNYLSMNSSALCKMYVTVMNTIGVYSLILLDCIAVERYRKVCQNTRVHFSQRTTRLLFGLNCVFMIVAFIIPGVLIFGINRKTTKAHSLDGYECTVLNNYKNSALVNVYRGFLFITVVTLLLISIVSYILIGRRIYIHQKNNITTRNPQRTKHLTSQPDVVYSDTTISITPVRSSPDSEITTDSYVMSTAARDPDMKRDNSVASKSDKVGQSTEKEKAFLKSVHERKRKKLVKSRNVTKVFLVVSVISFGVYLPYLLTTVIRNINRPLYENFADNYGSIVYFITWMIFINNAINPIVYGFMDRTFRQELSAFYIQMKRCLVSWRHG
ncbi:probable G-protein coupled receptor No18 [Ylistrum balloti]|uniref:probable G-protein coupled receptor No18 n=1 Tax=Ylistrum balloti TaxID=509963 RepID=UPI002905EEA0|nr:probable G-protein coupled receptor No18 [Ylistrum balloti]